jgi:hypothetical protein
MTAKAEAKSAKGAAGLVRAAAAASGAMARHAARANELLDLIQRRVGRIQEDFFDIGTALRELKDKKLFVSLGFRTFDAMLKKRSPVGRSQAYKLMAIVGKVTRNQAIELGEEKAYAIARLVATTAEPDTVASVLEKGVVIGKKRQKPATMSRREIDAAKRTLVEQTKKPDPEARAAERAAREARALLHGRGAKEARVEAKKVKGQWWAVVHLPVRELSLGLGER